MVFKKYGTLSKNDVPQIWCKLHDVISKLWDFWDPETKTGKQYQRNVYLNNKKYPTKWEIKKDNSNMKTRSSNTMQLSEPGMTNVLCSTFMSDAAHLWNKAPESIKASTTLYQAKKNIRTYSVFVDMRINSFKI